jgi:2'-hydroxyisoflavone reductase
MDGSGEMRLLILGGTVFLGRALVEAALQHGHDVALFNRGHTNPDLFPEVEKLRGDRSVDLSVLDGRRWDAVIDTSGYVPRVVRASAKKLAQTVDHYTFVSTISVYADTGQPGLREDAAVGTLADPTVEQVTGETYGPLKALCEQAVGEVMPGRALIVRPGLIVGPHDPTDRFTYWPVRVAEGGAVLAPGRPGRPVQIIDVRDLAEWLVRGAQEGLTGVYNATGPAQRTSMADLLAACKASSGSDATFEWVDDAFLLERGVAPWSDLPLWIPDSAGEHIGMLAVDNSRALAAGLMFRSLEEVVATTLDRARGQRGPHEWKAGLARERESALLNEWRAHREHS